MENSARRASRLCHALCLAAFLTAFTLAPAEIQAQEAQGAGPAQEQAAGAAADGGAAAPPAFREKPFDPRKAWNFKDIEEAYGPFSDEQLARLARDRLLLLPQRPGSRPEARLENTLGHDEMLSGFESLGGPWEPFERLPRHARFVGPDVILHAFHKYFEQRQKEAETVILSPLLRQMLEGAYRNALDLRSRAPQEARPAWDLALAQMAVPLTLISTAGPPPEYPGMPEGDEDSSADTAEAALANFAAREGDLPEDLRAEARAAILSVYAKQAQEGVQAASVLGLEPSYASQSVDWSQFTPRSYYEVNSRLRAYFRAMIWLGQLGWRRDNPGAYPQAVAWALALAGPRSGQAPAAVPSAAAPETGAGADGADPAAEGGQGGEGAGSKTPLQAWTEIMDITSFFAGGYDDPSLNEVIGLCLPGPQGTQAPPEAQGGQAPQGGQGTQAPQGGQGTQAPQDGLGAQAQQGAPPGPGAPGDQEYLASLAPRMALLEGSFSGFSELRKGGYAGKGVITPLPQRFTVPWFITFQLTVERAMLRNEPTLMPKRFSSLYLADVLGSAYASSLVPRQLAETRDTPPPADPGGPDPALEAAAAAYQAKKSEVGEALGRVSPPDWRLSAAASWLNALRTLTRSYGEGYPLYMRGPAYGAKQLETLLGSYTELRHDTLLYDKPNYAEGGNGSDEETPRRLPKGFVEPNLEFWDAVIAAVSTLEDGFRELGIFGDDLGEGNLGAFKGDLGRLASIARRELSGESVGEEDYEFIRTFWLDYLAAERGSSGGTPSENSLSGLICDIQTVLPDPNGGPNDQEGILYEALGPPSLMLVLVGNDGEERVTVGMAFDHYELFLPRGARLTDSAWKGIAYRGLAIAEDIELRPNPELLGELPPKPFWYEPLLQ
ncbi:MAG: DUF3160 domain-containing protein [Deltaproteobacteria bacterium]|jgi:hypothetical protein|nr:DUF3160 domain-containing protein [Deltaproteobacteria bacterium]